jgi:hypothetical protein
MASVRFTGRCDASTVRMISCFSEAGYLMRRPRSPLSSDHVWMAPAWQGVVIFRRLVGCGHVYGVEGAA